MTVQRALALVASAFCASLAAFGAAAQPLILPGARAPVPAEIAPGSAPPRSGPGRPGARIIDMPSDPTSPRPPPVSRPVAAKAVSEEGVLNRDLKLNGANGSLRLERLPRSTEIRAKVTLNGIVAARPAESCEVKIEGGAPVTVEPRGKPDGLPRYELKAASCPISFDVVDGGVWVSGPSEACVDEASVCRADPRGLWGPEPATLMSQARTIEQNRGTADKAVRENYKVMTQRASPGEMRSIVTEQAAFSSEREQQCRDYAREGGHGFCHARFTEARAALLAAKLGTTASVPPPAEAVTAAAPRPKKRRPAPVRRAGADGSPRTNSRPAEFPVQPVPFYYGAEPGGF